MSNEFAEKKIRKFVSYYMREHKNAFKKGTSPGNVLWSELKQFILKNEDVTEEVVFAEIKVQVRAACRFLKKGHGTCRRCGTTENLTKHHTNIIRNPFSYTILCLECHNKVHKR